MEDNPTDPCEQCLVKVMCSEPCSMLCEYIDNIIKLVVTDPEHEVLGQFPSSQRGMVKRAADIARRNKSDD